jgi:phage-related protein (TIGR01555 family)
MAKVSIKRISDRAKRENKLAEEKHTQDSLQNFVLGIGVGTGNAASQNTYGFNPITRIRTQLEWMYRGSWLPGALVDVVADDMTREGVELAGEMEPDEKEEIEELATQLYIWERVAQTIKRARLYGGCVAVLLVRGQNYSTPFKVETVGPGQFAGLLVLDRWMVDPSLNDLITDIGPHMGLPRFYTVDEAAPALRGQKIHYSRVLRMVGDELPYWQATTENLWGMSVLERPFAIVSQYDAATAGASQMVSKSYLRYFKVEKYRDIMGGLGGPNAMIGLQNMVATMRMFASNEGISIIDTKDEMVTTQATNFTGMAEILLQLAQQISGAAQIPLIRLLGQSPGGLNSTGDSDVKTYNDGIKRRQQHITVPMTMIYRCMAQSLGIDVGGGFHVKFRPLWQMDETQKSEIAQKDAASIIEVHAAGLVSDQQTLQMLQQVSAVTGRFQAIDDAAVDAASDEILPPIEMPPAADPGANRNPESDEEAEKIDAEAA